VRQHVNELAMLVVTVLDDDFDSGILQPGRLGETQVIEAGVRWTQAAMAVDNRKRRVDPTGAGLRIMLI
jgi:hypothetical protein